MFANESLDVNKQAIKKKNELWSCCENDEQVVISGIAGIFPNSDNTDQLEKNLRNMEDMVSDDDRRWKPGNPNIPQRTGKLNEINKFDSVFFGISETQAKVMDPASRILLEKSYEAIIDAGFNPKELKGSKTGVFIGVSVGSSVADSITNKELWNAHTIPGMVLCMLANRISFWLDVHGPSYTVDTACSSSMYALENAYKAIRIGDCEAAIVGGCNLCLHPVISLLFNELGVISPDGKCKCFDVSGNGYARSESVAVVFLQKKKDARRMYARVVHAKTNSDGYKVEGVHFPSAKMQTNLLKEFYEECNVNPIDLQFFEAHATGTKVGDCEELKAIEAAVLPGRKEPLKIGSIKSNIGHSEPASGLCSIIKVILSFESGILYPNIHLENLRSDIDGFRSGKMKVVCEPTPWNSGLTAVNSFGFGGANCHVLLDANAKTKSKSNSCPETFPVLVVASGRTEEAVDVILNDFEKRSLDMEYVGLMHKIHEENIPLHHFRGYTIIKEDKQFLRGIKEYTSGIKRPVWFVFSGMGSQWPMMGKSLMKEPLFAESIHKSHRVLVPKGVDLIKIVSSSDPKMLNNILNSYVGIVAIQIALTDVLSAINIKPDGFIGHSLGEIGCAYADETLTQEQSILTAYYRGLALLKSELIEGSMAAIGLGYKDISSMIGADIDIACHNGSDNCTISGPKNAVRNFVKSVQERGIFAQEVNSSAIALHSRYIKHAGEQFLRYLGDMNLKPKLRSQKWISSTFIKSDWNTNEAKYMSAKYLMINMLGTVYFEEAMKSIPENAIVIEVAPHGLLQAILKRSLTTNNISIPLTSRKHHDNLEYLLGAFGKIFQAGINLRICELYPPIEFPVSRGTPMISPLVKWDHQQDWYVYKHEGKTSTKFEQRTVFVSLTKEENKYLFGHVINRKNIYPAAGYLTIVWEILSSMNGKSCFETPVVFQDIKFLRMTNIPESGTIEFNVHVHRDSNSFEMYENGDLIVSGKVNELNETSGDGSHDTSQSQTNRDNSEFPMRKTDVYKELKSKGYQYNGLFQGITALNFEGTYGKIRWSNNLTCFIDSMIQMTALMYNVKRPSFVPISIQKIVIDTGKHFSMLNNMEVDNQVFTASGNKSTDTVQCGGIEIEHIDFFPLTQKRKSENIIIEKRCFVPYINPKLNDFEQMIAVVAQICTENFSNKTIEVIELVDNFTNTERSLITKLLTDCFKQLREQINISILADSAHPLITEELVELTKKFKILPTDERFSMVIVSRAMRRRDVINSCLKSLSENGFLLTQEIITETFPFENMNLNICFDCTIGNERILLLRKIRDVDTDPIVVTITRSSYSWLSNLQEVINQKKDLILLAEKDPLNGIYGLFKSIQKETKKENIRCFFILDDLAPSFSTKNLFYTSQIGKALSMNIYKDGVWGSYSHQLLEDIVSVPTAHSYMNTLITGDLTTLKWVEGPLDPSRYKVPENKVLLHVYYAALNFRDVMLATGKLSVSDLLKTRNNQGNNYLEKEFALGIECVGKTCDGRRYMGFLLQNAMSNIAEFEKDSLWDVPDCWSLQDAATVPMVYGTVIYALIMRAQMKEGESVLIHSATGGIGLAAINICLHYKCNIFITVGRSEKKEYIRKTFPSIPEDHIGNSHDTSFEKMINNKTKGKGVDIVLNSLSEDKLYASIRCLAFKGRFLEIGKFDICRNSPLGMKCFLNEISFHGINLNSLNFDKTGFRELTRLFKNALKEGAVKPLDRIVVSIEQVELAFRLMASGGHIGKILLKLRKEEPDIHVKPSINSVMAIPRYFGDSEKSYIICGGLGGIGLELSEWLIHRGVRNLILTSRNGVTNGYQARRIKLWQSHGVNVVIYTCDIGKEDEVEKLLKTVNSLRPVSAIFNLAAVLSDNLLANQSEESFAVVVAPKAIGTVHLDNLSRVFCPELKHFVVFSSIVGSSGNAGQTNYGMSNSIASRICEQRKLDNLPALAIEWGPIADIGILTDAKSDLILAGSAQLDITSCLELLDHFFNQPNSVIRAFLLTKSSLTKEGSLLEMIANILGIRKVNSINLNSRLIDAGVDSITSLEIRNLFETNYGIFLLPNEVRELTFSKICEIENNLGKHTKISNRENSDVADTTGNSFVIEYVAAVFSSDLTSLSADASVVRLPSEIDKMKIGMISLEEYPTVFIFPGMDGIPKFMEPLAINLQAYVYCVCYPLGNVSERCEDLAELILNDITTRIPVNTNFYIIGFSFGAIIAMEITRLLEKERRSGRLWLLDFAPNVAEKFMLPELKNGSFDVLASILEPRESFVSEFNKKKRRTITQAITSRFNGAKEYANKTRSKLNTQTTLIRSKKSIFPLDEDYGLSAHFKNPVNIYKIEANHFLIPSQKKTAKIIMEEIITDKNSIHDNHNEPNKILKTIQ